MWKHITYTFFPFFLKNCCFVNLYMRGQSDLIVNSLYIYKQLKQIPGIEIGLYRDDGLAVLNQTPRQIEKAKKKTNMPNICEQQPKITVDANMKVVDFLDVGL